MTMMTKPRSMRELAPDEIEQVSGGWLDSFDFGTFYNMPALFGLQVVSGDLGNLRLPPIAQVLGLPPIDLSGLDLGIGGGLGGTFPSLAGLNLGTVSYDPAADAANAAKRDAQHTPPSGYHFSEMDPEGKHYMVKDGDPNNSLVITPWYQQRIDSQDTNWTGVVADLGIIVAGAAGGAGGLVPGITVVLGSAAATIKELWGGPAR